MKVVEALRAFAHALELEALPVDGCVLVVPPATFDVFAYEVGASGGRIEIHVSDSARMTVARGPGTCRSFPWPFGDG